MKPGRHAVRTRSSRGRVTRGTTGTLRWERQPREHDEPAWRWVRPACVTKPRQAAGYAAHARRWSEHPMGSDDAMGEPEHLCSGLAVLPAFRSDDQGSHLKPC